MALIIEDGSGVANANSFTTDAEFVAYASIKGYVIPATESERDTLQVNGYDFISFTYESRLQGERVFPQVQTGCMLILRRIRRGLVIQHSHKCQQ